MRGAAAATQPTPRPSRKPNDDRVPQEERRPDADAPPAARLGAVSRKSGSVKRPGDGGLCGAALSQPRDSRRSSPNPLAVRRSESVSSH